ncbi:iron chelate uptake ABC transporter family permease subunit [uncultured Corynebacterium sp.]|uniref:FecCD family ABC transporter permease n=1 Tax=uncultured Corynebacterium sp. TaxID=159447 RepID=UPI0025CE7304|nr:iron ABC transporter permease [uncultured Corynebacterium sp.]
MFARESSGPDRRVVSVLVATAGFAVIWAVAHVLLLSVGPVGIPPATVVDVLVGGGTGSDIAVVWDLRMPMAIATGVVGAALGVAGAWTQTSARNPIASPDVLGVSGGASVAVVLGTLVARPEFAEGIPTFWWRCLLAMAGAATIVALLFALDGLGTSRRVILVGVALALMCQAAVSYLLLRADLARAAEAQTWLAGSTGFVRWQAVPPLVLATVPFLLLGASRWREVPLLAHDDDSARALGVDVNRVRTILLIASTGLVAATVSVVGPIGFVALLAPQVARLASRAPTPPPLASAAAGAALLSSCAVIAGALPVTAPVGLVTAIIGGPVLAVLVMRGRASRITTPRRIS